LFFCPLVQRVIDRVYKYSPLVQRELDRVYKYSPLVQRELDRVYKYSPLVQRVLDRVYKLDGLILKSILTKQISLLRFIFNFFLRALLLKGQLAILGLGEFKGKLFNF